MGEHGGGRGLSNEQKRQSHGFSLTISESKSFGLRGNRVFVESLESSPIHRRWIDIKKLILGSPLRKSLQKKILYVFNILASAEASVDGIEVDKVEFHEIGSIDSLVDVVGVCASIEYLNPSFIFCATPPSGSGFVELSAGTKSINSSSFILPF